MTRAFVSVGSNIHPAQNVRNALRLLARSVTVVQISTVYSTEPEGRPEQPRYYNCVVEIETDLEPRDLKHLVLRRIEKDLGRERSADKYAPRTMDIDLILYDDLMLETDDLILPDPQILSRPFLAIPLYELAPELTLPGSGVRIADAAPQLRTRTMEPLESYTELLRKEVLSGDQYGKD